MPHRDHPKPEDEGSWGQDSLTCSWLKEEGVLETSTRDVDLDKLVGEFSIPSKLMKPGPHYVVAPDVYSALRQVNDQGGSLLPLERISENSFLPPGTVLELNGQPASILPGPLDTISPVPTDFNWWAHSVVQRVNTWDSGFGRTPLPTANTIPPSVDKSGLPASATVDVGPNDMPMPEEPWHAGAKPQAMAEPVHSME